MPCAARLLLGVSLLIDVATTRAAVVPSPPQKDFRDQAVNVTSAPLATTFTNTGDQTATVTAVSAVNVAGVNIPAYVRSGGTCGQAPFTIAPQASCTIEHTFTPLEIRAYYGYANLTLAGGGQVDYGMAGRGDVAYLDIVPSSTWFAPVAVGTTSTQELTTHLQNSRPVGMVVTQMSALGADAGAFVRTGGTCPTQTPFDFGAYGSCSLSYRFMPTHVGPHSMNMYILGSGSFGFPVSGDGLPEVPLFKNGFEVPAQSLTE